MRDPQAQAPDVGGGKSAKLGGEGELRGHRERPSPPSFAGRRESGCVVEDGAGERLRQFTARQPLWWLAFMWFATVTSCISGWVFIVESLT